MCCIFKICFNSLTKKPEVFGFIQMLVALVHLIVTIIYIAPYAHCETSQTFTHGALVSFQKLECSNIHHKTVIDNAVIFENKFDLMRLMSAYIVLDVFMIIACIIFLVGVCTQSECCLIVIFYLPFIAMSGLIIATDIIFMIIWAQTYKNHESSGYFYQMLGIRDKMAESLIKETMQNVIIDPLDNLTMMKTTNLFGRLVYDIMTLFFMILAIKKFMVDMCPRNKETKE